MSSFEPLDTSRNHQRTLWVPGTNYFEHAFVPKDNSAPQGLHPEWQAEGAKGGKSSKKNCPKTSFYLFREILSSKERPCKGREAGMQAFSFSPLVISFSCREARCSTHRNAPTSATGFTKHQTHPAPLSAVADGSPLYLRRHRSISRCAEISPR